MQFAIPPQFARLSLLALLALAVLTEPVPAAEIYSNASGGGAWSDPATWRGGKVPTPEDDVILARDDVVTFDRFDEKEVTCRQLMLDPRSVLQFEMGTGPVVMTVGGLIESYGAIRLDATRAATDRHELRLVAEDPEQRACKVYKGGSLVVVGRTGLPKGRRNAALRSLPRRPEAKDVPFDPTASIECQVGSTMDVQRVEVENVYLQALNIDNTGAKPGERVNIVRNKFIGWARLNVYACDTPLVADNLFERSEMPVAQWPALYLTACPLADVRGNTIRGTYSGGVTCYGQNDSVLADTLIEKCPQGLYWYGANGMVRNLTIRNCGHAITFTSASGAMEDVTVEGCTSGYYHGGATMQATNLVFKNMAKESAYDIYYSSGPLVLLNCPIKLENIKFDAGFPQPPINDKPRPPAITSLSFLMVKLNGQYPPGAGVELKTTAPLVPLAPGAADPNIRNSPAPVQSSGFTPFPKTLEPLIVRGWMVEADGKQHPAPAYTLNVLAPAEATGTERKVLKSVSVTPAPEWYRSNPNEKMATVEVTLP